MRNFKIADHDLYSRQWEWSYSYQLKEGRYTHNPVTPGMKVCSKQRLETMGIITHLGDDVQTLPPHNTDADQTTRVYVRSVTVLWLTGSKKGKTEIKKTSLLSDFSSYKSAVMRHVGEIEKIEAEAAQTGL